MECDKVILTFKIRHDRDFSPELEKGKRIAEFVLSHKTRSSKDVKQFGLKSAIANQILRKYGNNKTVKSVNRIKLTVPSQSIKADKERRTIEIPCLKFKTPYSFRNDYDKINQIELDNDYAYVSVNIKEQPQITPKVWLGLDRNTTGHIAVLANPETGKVLKLGKEALHIHNKYKSIRKDLQKKGKFGLVKKIRNRESRIIRNLNHQISKEIVKTAMDNNAGIKLEKLEGIRKSRNHSRKFNYSLHSWSFYQLQNLIEYKAMLCGIPLTYVEPRNTSKECSRCGNVGIRDQKKFVCHDCGHVDHADANASFNIALRQPIGNIGQLNADRDAFKGSTDTPRGATL
jgi:putative transposase